jgi:hypothetical protein
MAETKARYLTSQLATLLLINDKPYKVFLDHTNEGIIDDEIRALEAAGIKAPEVNVDVPCDESDLDKEKTLITCMSIPIIQNNTA